jgi:hypothetical protein
LHHDVVAAWTEIVECAPIEVLSGSDVHSIELAATAVALFRRCSSVALQSAPLLRGARSDREWVRNPAYGEARRWALAAQRMLEGLALSPTARASMRLTWPPSAPDPREALLSRGGP